MTTSEPGLRSKILSVATGLFIQHGYHGLAMRQIAEALEVSKPAIYYHFKNKEELFLAILTMYLDEMETVLNRITDEPATCREKVREFMEYVLVQPPKQSAIIHLASQEVGHLSKPARKVFGKVYQEKFIGKIAAILTLGMQQGEFKSVEPEVATWALLGIMYPYLYPAGTENRALADKTIQQIITVYLDGINTKNLS
jgi:TetR/AcrR family transcriptional regulator, cholesterol catabolism regulator